MNTTEYTTEEDLSQALRVYVFKSVGEQSRKRMSGNYLVRKHLDTGQSYGSYGLHSALMRSIHP